jgi:hypothetical protein
MFQRQGSASDARSLAYQRRVTHGPHFPSYLTPRQAGPPPRRGHPSIDPTKSGYTVTSSGMTRLVSPHHDGVTTTDKGPVPDGGDSRPLQSSQGTVVVPSPRRRQPAWGPSGRLRTPLGLCHWGSIFGRRRHRRRRQRRSTDVVAPPGGELVTSRINDLGGRRPPKLTLAAMCRRRSPERPERPGGATKLGWVPLGPPLPQPPIMYLM